MLASRAALLPCFFINLAKRAVSRLHHQGSKVWTRERRKEKGLRPDEEEKEPEPGLSVPVYAIPAHLCLSLFFSGE
jgi:hypothetical protein